MKPLRQGRWSLAYRMSVWYAVSSFLLVSIVAGLLYHALFKGIAHEDDVLISQNLQTLRSLLDKPSDEMDEFRQELALEKSSGRPILVWLRIITENGKVVAQTPGMSQTMPVSLFPKAVQSDEELLEGKTVDFGDGRIFRVLSARGSWRGHRPSAVYLQVGFDQGKERNILKRFREKLWMVLGFSLLGCVGVGYGIAYRGIKPVKRMARTATRIRSATLNERLITSGLPSELYQLASTFNNMLDRLEDSFVGLSRFSADMAHELRTPLQNLRGETEVVLRRPRTEKEYQELLGSCMEEYERLSTLIDRLLFLARAENAAIILQKERMNVEHELNLLKEYYDLLAGEKELGLEVAAPKGLEIMADRALFQRAVGNLVENSMKHTSRNGKIRIEAVLEDAKVRVEVSDNGEGIASDQLPHVFDRFYRADPSRSSASGGAGLGLSIVQGIMVLHGGSVDIESQPARGTKVILLFPQV